jgi:ribosomal protein S27AE
MEDGDQEKKAVKLKSYYCPHCGKALMTGDVKRLNMTCQHCHQLINAPESELLKSENQ